METIIGLGSAGCRLADVFSKYPQYDTYKIDTNISGEKCFRLPAQHNPEDYEKNVPDMSNFLEDIEGDVLFIIGGGGKISGAALRIMKQLKNCSINVAYIRPNTKTLTNISFLHERVTYNVLQEYARSAIFKKIFLIDNTIIEKIVGDVPILEYNNKLNEVIVSAFHYYNVFTHTDSILENVEPPKETNRICTLGILDVENGLETPFFNLENISYKCYYYAVPEEVLKTDGKLFKNIKEKVSEDRSSYQVHETKHKQTFAYFIAQTSKIQLEDSQRM